MEKLKYTLMRLAIQSQSVEEIKEELDDAFLLFQIEDSEESAKQLLGKAMQLILRVQDRNLSPEEIFLETEQLVDERNFVKNFSN